TPATFARHGSLLEHARTVESRHQPPDGLLKRRPQVSECHAQVLSRGVGAFEDGADRRQLGLALSLPGDSLLHCLDRVDAEGQQERNRHELSLERCLAGTPTLSVLTTVNTTLTRANRPTATASIASPVTGIS